MLRARLEATRKAARDERAVHVDVVEDREAEVVRAYVLTLVEHDLDAAHLNARDVDDLSRVGAVGREGEDGPVAPPESDPARAIDFARGGSRSRVAADEVVGHAV